MSEATDLSHPSGSPLAELARVITAGAVRLAAATAAWLRLVAEFDERGGWHGWGITSCGHWLSWQCGLAPGAAREHVRVARALRGLPHIEAAFSDGRISYSKVRALTRIAEPDTEQSLLDLAAQATAAQLERFVRSWRRVDHAATDPATDDGAPAPPEPSEPPEARMSFDHWWDEQGMLTLKLRMPAEPGADLLAAIDSLAEREARRERAQNRRARHARSPGSADSPGSAEPGGGDDWREQEELDRRCADDDELAGLARERTTARRLNALASLARARVELDRRAGDPPRREVIVHVDADVIAEDTAAGRAYLEGGPALTGAQARRLLCEATVVTMLERGRQPLALGRTRRRASKAQRRALLRRDGGCARPGCPETRIERLHAHHLRHWLAGGRTDLDNLVLLCDVDHGLVHDLDLAMTRVRGRLLVTAPDGRHVWGTADAAFTTGLAGLTGLDDQHATDPADGRDPVGAQHPTDSATHPPTGHRPRPTTADPCTGVHPTDATTGRRPAPPGAEPAPAPDDIRQPGPNAARRPTRIRRPHRRRPTTCTHRPAARPTTAPIRPTTPPSPGSRRGRRVGGLVRPTTTRPTTTRPTTTRPTTTRPTAASIGRILFPQGSPPLLEVMPTNGEPIDLDYAIGVLMGNRDLLRRLTAEAGP